MATDKKIITRFPPSPTGYLHIGSVRTALYNYLFAQKEKGSMYLRFEDTDKERSKKEYEEDILAGLKWLGISYELPEIFRQSERTDIYRKHLTTLLEKGLAFEAEEAKDGEGKKVVRFKNPNTKITFTDIIRGEVTFDTTELGDFVIAKNSSEPLYHLAVIIDDFEMGITHVIRGEDHISNTPRQILMLEALGFPRPQYAHIPLILAPDKTKLSKRHGAVSVNEYQAQGFLPGALLNYLALLGWNPGGEREDYSLSELSEIFDLSRVHKGGAVFDIEKLKWFNHLYIQKLSNEEFKKLFEEYSNTTVDSRLIPLLKERSQTLKEAVEVLNNEFDFLTNTVSIDKELLIKGAKVDATVVATHLTKAVEILEQVTNWNAETVKETVFPYATEVGRAGVLWPMRVALSGKEKSPDPFTLCGILGKEESLMRLKAALTMVQ